MPVQKSNSIFVECYFFTLYKTKKKKKGKFLIVYPPQEKSPLRFFFLLNLLAMILVKGPTCGLSYILHHFPSIKKSFTRLRKNNTYVYEFEFVFGEQSALYTSTLMVISCIYLRINKNHPGFSSTCK